MVLFVNMEGFRHKTEEELQDQADSTSKVLGAEITHASLSSEIFSLTLDEIKYKYPERYKTYLKIIIAQKNKKEIDAKELEEMREWISALNNLDSYIIKHTPHYDKFEARDKKQFDVYGDIRDSLERGEKEGYIKLPTGVGKTVLFSRVIESLGRKTLIVVPSKILIGQTGERLEEFTDVEFGKFFQGEKNLSENVTITTYSSLVRGIKSGSIDPEEYPVLILDEAHKALGEESRKAIKQFEGVKLGFTATPKFSEYKHVSDILEHEIHSMGIVEAVKGGLISKFKSYIAYTDTDLSKVEVKNRDKYDEDELERAIDHEGRNQSAVELYKKEFDGQLAIAYCGGVTHAKHVAELFNKSGVKAEIISGETPDDKSPEGKEAILERFRTGETKVLCNARILIEGFDEPKASVCLNLQPTLSLVDAEQRAGRVLRIDPDNPDKWAYIVDFIDREPVVAPRTFVEIAEASEVDGEHAVIYERGNAGGSNLTERQEVEKIPYTDIKGLRVFTNSKEVMSIVSDFLESRYENVPEGWAHRFDIAKRTDRAFITVERMAEKYRESNPQWFKEYRSLSTGRISEYFSPELVQILTEGLTSMEDAPLGWMTASQLKDELGGGVPKVQRIASFYREDHPEWFKNHLDKRGIPYEFFAPELVTLIRESLESREEAPVGWEIPVHITSLINATLPRIKSRADTYRIDHPEWFRFYSLRGMRPIEHYSPELVDELKKSLEAEVVLQNKEVPLGWMMVSQLKEELGGGFSKFHKVTDLYRKEHPEWFASYPDQRRNLREYLAPPLVQIIKEMMKSEDAPAGWMSGSEIVRKSGFSSNKIKKLLDKYKLTSPDSFKMYKESSGRVLEHIAPDIIEKILNDSNKHEKAPTGWLTLGTFSRQIDEDQKTLSRKAEGYRKDHPDWFKIYLDDGNRPYEHFSPELLDKLKKEVSSIENAPEGWMYNNAISIKINKKRERIKQVADSFRGSHPQWFKVYKEKKGKVIEHFSPELVTEIEKVLIKK